MDEADRVVLSHSGKFLAYLIAMCGDFNLAEDLQQDVLLIALTKWREEGVPENPLAWLITTARNKATDHFRRTKRKDRIMLLLEEEIPEQIEDEVLDELLGDDFLRLIFICCHPALAPHIRVALTLKSVVGLSLDEVARAFVVSTDAMEQRLVRAKRKIKTAKIPYVIPKPEQLEDRLDSVMQTIYLMFNEGYAATTGDALTRPLLCRESIRLAATIESLFPQNSELLGLLSLMILQDSRRDARLSDQGELVPLDEQDRGKWDSVAIKQGIEILERALLLHQAPGPYQLQAAIAALHAEAKTSDETDWQQIVLLYEALLKRTASPVVRLNYAVALAMNEEANEALSQLDLVADALAHFFPYWCARAHLMTITGQEESAVFCLNRAEELAGNDRERMFVTSKRKAFHTSR